MDFYAYALLGKAEQHSFVLVPDRAIPSMLHQLQAHLSQTRNLWDEF
jgi:hypothetical protein